MTLALALHTPELGPCAVTPREYQARAIRELRAEIAKGSRYVLLVAPTAAGKTLTASLVIRGAIEKGGEVLVLAHRSELLDQMYATCERVGIPRAWLQVIRGGDRRRNPGARVHIASVDTLRNWVGTGRLPKVRVIVIDEAHRSAAAGYVKIREAYPDAIVIGLTATPWRLDGKALDTLYTSSVVVATIPELVQQGALVPVRCFTHPKGPDLSGVRTKGGDFDQEQAASVMRSRILLGSIVDEYKRRADGRAAFGFACNVAHAQELAEACSAAGIASVAIHGETPEAERKAALEGLRSGGLDVLWNCLDEKTEILTERGWVGIDTIVETDKTAAFNVVTGTAEFQPILRIVRRPRAADERMVTFSNAMLDMRVTEGHRMVTRASGARSWSIVEAGTLPTRRGPYEFPISAQGPIPDGIVAPNGSVQPRDLTLDQCRFIGLWITDGTIDRKGWRGIEITQSNRYPEANEEIRRILTACEFDWKHSESKHATGLEREGGVQHRYRVPRGTGFGPQKRRGYVALEAYLDKDFSPLLFGLNAAQTGALIEGLWLGDGVKNVTEPLKRGRHSWPIVNTNTTLLDRLQRLAVLRGFSANISAPKYNGPRSTRPIYRISIRHRGSIATNKRSVPSSGGNPARFETEYKEERVWCVTNELGTIFTRRNGKVVVMGQCALFTEGTDVPQVKCVILARPTLSKALAFQMIGRGMRPCPETGFADCVLLDHAGVLPIHGHPMEPQDYALTSAKVKASGPAQTKNCPSCGETVATGATLCACGHTWERAEREGPTVVPGKLEEIKPKEPKVMPPIVERGYIRRAFAIAARQGIEGDGARRYARGILRKQLHREPDAALFAEEAEAIVPRAPAVEVAAPEAAELAPKPAPVVVSTPIETEVRF